MARPRENASNRFDAKWRVDRRTGCWVWTAGTSKGYGRFVSGGRGSQVFAHRFSYEREFGAIPAGRCVCHACDNPICVNPDHLFLGTLADNNADRRRKGRSARGAKHGTYTTPSSRCRGERNGSSKLTREIVEFIRRVYAHEGLSHARIAASVGVSETQVRRIIRKESWR